MTSPPAIIDEFTLLCERCGYVVEGLPTEEVCPECAKPIAESLPQRRQLRPSFWRTLTSPRATLHEIGFEWVDQVPLGPSCGKMTMVFGITALAAIFLSAGIIDVDETAGSLPFVIGLAPIPLIVVFALCYGISQTHVALLIGFSRLQRTRINRRIARCICTAGSAGLFVFAFGTGLGFGASASGLILTLGTFYDEAVIYGKPVPALRAMDALFWAGCLIGAAGLLFFETFVWLGLHCLKYANRTRTHKLPASGAES